MQSEKSLISEVEPFLTYSEELKNIAPIISFTAQFYFVQQGLQTANRPENETKELALKKKVTEQILGKKLEELEKMKKDLAHETAQEVGLMRYKVENFVRSVFAQLLEEEDATQKEHGQLSGPLEWAKRFRQCQHFVQMLSYFNYSAIPEFEDKIDPVLRVPISWKEKHDFCQFKATYFAHCHQVGRPAKAGNPLETDPAFLSQSVAAKNASLSQRKEVKHQIQVAPQPAAQPQNPKAEAKLMIAKAISELDFGNVQAAIWFFEQAAGLIKK